MALQRLDRIQWVRFCDSISASLLGKRAEIDIVSLDFGVQHEGRSLPVVGVSYDPHDDVVLLALEGLEHMILHPREMYVDIGLQGVESVGILDDSDRWQIVMLHDPLMLPSPTRL